MKFENAMFGNFLHFCNQWRKPLFQKYFIEAEWTKFKTKSTLIQLMVGK